MQEAHTDLGVLLSQQGKLAVALRHYQRAHEIPPGTGDECSNLGRCLANLGRLDEALERFREAIRLEPWRAESRAAAAELLNARPQASPGERREALSLAEEAHRL